MACVTCVTNDDAAGIVFAIFEAMDLKLRTVSNVVRDYAPDAPGELR